MRAPIVIYYCHVHDERRPFVERLKPTSRIYQNEIHKSTRAFKIINAPLRIQIYIYLNTVASIQHIVMGEHVVSLDIVRTIDADLCDLRRSYTCGSKPI